MSRLQQAAGKGRAGLDVLFPDHTPLTSTPWPRAGRRRGETDPRPHIADALKNPDDHVREVDPTDSRFRSTQPSITRAAVSHYLDHDDLYADQHQAGNQTPVVWRTQDGQGQETWNTMSGHHRQTTSALKGQQFRAVFVDDPSLNADSARAAS